MRFSQRYSDSTKYLNKQYDTGQARVIVRPNGKIVTQFRWTRSERDNRGAGYFDVEGTPAEILAYVADLTAALRDAGQGLRSVENLTSEWSG